MTSLFFIPLAVRVAHAEQYHEQTTTWLEHTMTQPETGFPIYVGGLIIIFLAAKLLIGVRLALPLAAIFSLLVAIFVGNSFVLLSTVAASLTAVLALIAVFEAITKHDQGGRGSGENRSHRLG